MISEEKKEEIKKCVKALCDKGIYDINYNNIKIEFEKCKCGLGSVYIGKFDTVKIIDKNEGFCSYVMAIDEPESIAIELLESYLIKRECFLEKKVKDEFKKSHPFLSLFI